MTIKDFIEDLDWQLKTIKAYIDSLPDEEKVAVRKMPQHQILMKILNENQNIS